MTALAPRTDLNPAAAHDRALLAAAFDFSPAPGALIQLPEGRLLHANRSLLHQLGYAPGDGLGEAAGRSLWADPAQFRDVCDALAAEGRFAGPAALLTWSGAAWETLLSAHVLDVPGAACAVLKFSDIAEQKRIEEALRESEERYTLTAHATADAVYEWDVQSGMTRWNHGMRTLFGYPVDDRQAHNWWREQVHPEDRERTVASVESALNRGERFWECQYRYRRADGSYAHVIDRGYVLFDGGGRPLRMLGAMIDITERVHLAEAQAQAALEERHRLARELHDSVTQSLYSLTLLAEAASRMAAAGSLDRVAQYVGRLGETAQQSLKEMRLLVYQLRPLALEGEGLAGALQHRLDAVEKRAGISARLLMEGELHLPPAIEDGLFRIAQEALNNALKHAQATEVTVRLCQGGGLVGLEVADNGQGFAPEGEAGRGGLGLTSMRERAETLRGSLRLETAPGSGSRVLAVVPCEDLTP